MLRRLTSLAATLAVVLALGACGGGGSGKTEVTKKAAGPEAAARTALTFVATDISWKEAPTTVAAGPVTFVIDNQGQIIHNLKVEGLPISLEAAPGAKEMQSLELNPGTYTFFCDVPGHREAGMEGKLAVS